MKRGHSPQRTCLGCGSRDDKEKLLRIVADGRGGLRLDTTIGSRGGYIHGTEACWEAFLRRKSLSRAFRMEIGREAKEKLVQGIRDRDREAKDG